MKIFLCMWQDIVKCWMRVVNQSECEFPYKQCGWSRIHAMKNWALSSSILRKHLNSVCSAGRARKIQMLIIQRWIPTLLDLLSLISAVVMKRSRRHRPVISCNIHSAGRPQFVRYILSMSRYKYADASPSYAAAHCRALSFVPFWLLATLCWFVATAMF